MKMLLKTLTCALLGHKPNYCEFADYVYDEARCDRCQRYIYLHHSWLGVVWLLNKDKT